jgi:hypothetical protein
MWWSLQEEQFQQMAESAWGIFPNALFVPPGLADNFEDLVAGPEDMGEEAGPVDEDVPPPIFQWHLPEGAPDPGPVGVLLNGFHEEDLLPNGFHADPVPNGFHEDPVPNGLLAVAIGPAWNPFHAPLGGDNAPD